MKWLLSLQYLAGLKMSKRERRTHSSYITQQPPPPLLPLYNKMFSQTMKHTQTGSGVGTKKWTARRNKRGEMREGGS